MARCSCCWLVYLIVFIQRYQHLTSLNITLFVISNLDDNLGQSVVGGEWLAIQEINNNSLLLPNYTFNFEIYDAHASRQDALIYALNATSYQNTPNHTYFPVVLDAPWSSLSASMTPLLGAFSMGQFSVSTSITLSNTNIYPYFYRTVPSDSLQAEGIILLCTEFNWTSIAVVYVNDEYGLYLALGIQSLASDYNIDVTSIAISEYEDVTYNYAAKQIRDLGLFIVVIIIHNSKIHNLITEFDDQGIIGYPYLYLGTDGWFDESVINKYNLSHKIEGFIGTLPWQSASLALNEYTEDIQAVINESIIKYNHVMETWSSLYNNGNDNAAAEHLYIENPGTFIIYGYDIMYSIAFALQEINNNTELYGGNVIELINNNNYNFIEIFNEVILNKTDFIGTSGRVLFDNFGDRISGLYSFGNILNNGSTASISYFGYLSNNRDGTVTFKFDRDKIIWPDSFNENLKGIIPHSDIVISEQLIYISSSTFIIITICLVFCILISFLFILLLICYRNEKIIKAASWRINVIMCAGSILGYIAAILYGFDDDHEHSELNTICNARLWLLTISFSILFMPLFSKTYRLSKLFKNILKGTILNDAHLLIIIGICVAIDLLLLIIVFFIHPLHRLYFNGNLRVIDQLQQTQMIYGACSDEVDILHSVYAILIFWKLCQLGFGLYTALNVSRIRDLTGYLTKFDETGIQLISISLTVIIITMSMTILLITNLYSTGYFILISITVILIGNVALFLNLLPRIFAVITNNGDTYLKSQDQAMKSKIKLQLKRYSVSKTVNLL